MQKLAALKAGAAQEQNSMRRQSEHTIRVKKTQDELDEKEDKVFIDDLFLFSFFLFFSFVFLSFPLCFFVPFVVCCCYYNGVREDWQLVRTVF
jgi:hypothetical protein